MLVESVVEFPHGASSPDAQVATVGPIACPDGMGTHERRCLKIVKIQWSTVRGTAVTVTVSYSDSFDNPRFI